MNIKISFLRNIITTAVVFTVTLTCSLSIFAQSGIQFPKDDSTSVKKDYPYVLPIWGQKVVDRNIELQKPFGINVNTLSIL